MDRENGGALETNNLLNGVGLDEFAARMAELGPFEPAPALAVGVSGGPDSLALCLLADAWVRRNGGRVAALTVDHGLRPGSDREARRVGEWLAARGIEHHTLRWEGEKPAADVQAAARQARYRLLLDRCRRDGVLHLLLAHHREDQAETVLLRLARGSGVDGLAAMAPLVEHGTVRILRPLLDTPKERLLRTLEALGQEWIEDPSNVRPEFARSRLRTLFPALGLERGLAVKRLADTARRMTRARAALDAATADLLVKAGEVHPAGFVWLDPAALARAPEEIGLRALARAVMFVGAQIYPPRQERLERLFREIAAGAGRSRTLAGCRIIPRAGRLLVCREPSAVEAAAPLPCPGEIVWDGRFRIMAGEQKGPLTVGPLDAEGWREVARRDPGLRADPAACTIPGPARPSLPAVRDEEGLREVPHLGWRRSGTPSPAIAAIAHAPPHPLTGRERSLV